MKSCSLAFLSILALISLSCPSLLNAAEMYSWTDEEGVTHLSDKPPPEGVKVDKSIKYDPLTGEEKQRIQAEKEAEREEYRRLEAEEKERRQILMQEEAERRRARAEAQQNNEIEKYDDGIETQYRLDGGSAFRGKPHKPSRPHQPRGPVRGGPR